MILTLHRISDSGTSTIGLLEDGSFSIYTLEDTYRKVKIWGRTRIPGGTYEIKLREEGTIHETYKKKFDFHKGMLWLQDVPNFQYIYFHIGNNADDSAGCILTGSNIVDEDNLSGSTVAYIKLYFHIMKAFNRKERVFIKIVDN